MYNANLLSLLLTLVQEACLLHAGNEKFGRFIAEKEPARCSLREAISLYALLLLKCIQKLHVNFNCTNNISFFISVQVLLLLNYPVTLCSYLMVISYITLCLVMIITWNVTGKIICILNTRRICLFWLTSEEESNILTGMNFILTERRHSVT